MIAKGRASVLKRDVQLVEPPDSLTNKEKPAKPSGGCRAFGRGMPLINSVSEKKNELGNVNDDVEDDHADNKKQNDPMNVWYYKDPNGYPRAFTSYTHDESFNSDLIPLKLGPFSHSDMEEWYKHGYFTDPALLIRRGCQKEFYSLQDLETQSLVTGDATPFVFIPPARSNINFFGDDNGESKNNGRITPSSILRHSKKSATSDTRISKKMNEERAKHSVQLEEETQSCSENSDVSDNICIAISSKDKKKKANGTKENGTRENGTSDSDDAVKRLLEKVTQLESQVTKLSTAPTQISINDLKALVQDKCTPLAPISPSSPKEKNSVPDQVRSCGLLTSKLAAERFAKDETVYLPAFVCEINGIKVETILNFELEINLIGQAIVDEATIETKENDRECIIPKILGIKSITNFKRRALFESFFFKTRFDNLLAGVVKSWSNPSTKRLWIGNKFMKEYEVRWTPDCRFILFEHPKRGGIYLQGYPFTCHRHH